MTNDNLEDRYVQSVREFSTVYGTVGDLTAEEEQLVRRLFHDHQGVREAGRAVLRRRALWPKDPHPRRHLESGAATRSGHMPYGFRGPQ